MMHEYDMEKWVCFGKCNLEQIKWSWFEYKIQIQTPYVIIQMPFNLFVLNSSYKLF